MKRYIAIILTGFIGGIVVTEYNVSYITLNFIAILLCGFTILFYFTKEVRTYFFRAVLLFLLFVSFGIARTQYSYQELPTAVFDDSVGTTVVFLAEVVSQIDNRSNYKTFTVQLIEEDQQIKNTPAIRVTTDRFTKVTYGDVVTVTGKLESVVMNSKTHEFTKESLVRKGILYQVNFAKVAFVKEGNSLELKKCAEYLRLQLISVINKNIDKPSSDFVNGILIGEKHALSKEWYDRFTNVGMTHVIVLSGYNLAVLFAWTRILFRRVPFVAQNVLGVMSVVALVLISGAEPPAIRAGILVVIVAFASIFRRQKDTSYFLSVTVLLMLLFNPFYFLYDVSFQLSIAATYGLVYIGPIVEVHLKRFPKIMRDATRDTFSAQIAVLPLQLFHFGVISSVSLISNVLLLPLIPLTMLLGAVTIITSPAPIIAATFGEATTFVSSVILHCVHLLSDTATSYTLSINIYLVVCLYVVLLVLILRYKK